MSHFLLDSLSSSLSNFLYSFESYPVMIELDKKVLIVLKISEASKKVGLSVPTIRYYAELNMIPSLKRNIENQREFDDESIMWLQGIKFFRELGMPLKEIQEYIKLCQKDGKTALLKRHQLLLKQQKQAEITAANGQMRLNELNRRINLEEEIINGRKRDSLSAARRFNQ